MSILLRYVPSGSGWKVSFTNLYGHDKLGNLKHNERQFVSDMTKYNIAHMFIIVALEDKYS